jgi:hypothetical protein
LIGEGDFVSTAVLSGERIAQARLCVKELKLMGGKDDLKTGVGLGNQPVAVNMI